MLDKTKVKRTLTVILVIVLGIFIWNFVISRKHKKEEYNGKIEFLWNDAKGCPHFRINGESFVLTSAGRNELMNGDSLVKKKGEREVYQYRNGRLLDFFKAY